MARRVKHCSLHRIASTELRVVADVEGGVLPLIEVEEAVIRRYAAQEAWPHRAVTLFVMQDLEPLSRQLGPGASLPPGGTAALEHRAVLNAYDLADPAECHVFVNQQAMKREGYWDDPLAIRGLLAHEHAHPLAENETTRASRSLELDVSVEGVRAPLPLPSAARRAHRATGSKADRDRRRKVRSLLALLGEKLCLYAPREIFANEVAIRSDFAEALLHVDRRAMANAARSVAGRQDLRQQLQQQVSGGSLTAQEAEALLLIGDLRGYLDLSLEVAAFRRAGREADAAALEGVLASEVFPVLAPEVPEIYGAVMEQYLALRADMDRTRLLRWAEAVLSLLPQALAGKAVRLEYRLRARED